MKYIFEHVDYEWVVKKIDGHGGSCFINEQRRMIIGYIGNKNRIQVFGYNIILYFRYLIRKHIERGERWHLE